MAITVPRKPGQPEREAIVTLRMAVVRASLGLDTGRSCHHGGLGTRIRAPGGDPPAHCMVAADGGHRRRCSADRDVV